MSEAGNGNRDSRGGGGRKGRRCGSTKRPIVEVRGLTKRFGAGPPVVDSVDLDIPEGELFVLLGPPGCGKTTLLRMLAGFETPSAGEIRIDGADRPQRGTAETDEERRAPDRSDVGTIDGPAPSG